MIKYNHLLSAVRAADNTYALVYRGRTLTTGLTGIEVRCGFEYLRARSRHLPPVDRIAAIVRACSG